MLSISYARIFKLRQTGLRFFTVYGPWGRPDMASRFPWASLPDEELLQLRLKDLKVTVEGTWLELCLRALHGELEQRGLRVRPHAWISNEWFSPDTTPGIAIPFYLAHPRLMRLERKMIIDVEGGTVPDCMAELRDPRPLLGALPVMAL